MRTELRVNSSGSKSRSFFSNALPASPTTALAALSFSCGVRTNAASRPVGRENIAASSRASDIDLRNDLSRYACSGVTRRKRVEDGAVVSIAPLATCLLGEEKRRGREFAG